MIVTTYFCAVCQDPFEGSKMKGGRMLCERHRLLAGKSSRRLLMVIGELEEKLDRAEADLSAAKKGET